MKISTTRRSPIFAVVVVALLIATCRTIQRSRAPLRAELHTDSTEIGVQFGAGAYFAKIGYLFVNTTSGPISLGGCGGPPMPELEKLVDGHWIVAYHPIYAACRTFPDFSLPSGAKYRNKIVFDAAPRGGRTLTQLEVDSISGVYRLHWIWNEGLGSESPTSRGAAPRPVEAISNQFRMTLR